MVMNVSISSSLFLYLGDEGDLSLMSQQPLQMKPKAEMWEVQLHKDLRETRQMKNIFLQPQIRYSSFGVT